MSIRFTISQLQQLKNDGKIRSFEVKDAVKPKQKLPKKKGKQVTYIENQLALWCKSKGYNLLSEHRFHPARKFRFDYAIEELMIAIEYEGLFSEKSGHTTISGYNKDVVKYNLAAECGWTVIRFTALNYKTIIQELEKHTR